MNPDALFLKKHARAHTQIALAAYLARVYKVSGELGVWEL